MKETFQRLANGHYKKQFTDPVTGQRRSLTAPTLSELYARIDEEKRLRRDLRYSMISREEALRKSRNLTHDVLTVREIWEAYAKTQRNRAVSRADFEVRIKPWLGNLPAVECTEERIAGWIASLERATYKKAGKLSRYSPKTVEGTFERLAAAFSLAVRAKKLDVSPFAGYRPKFAKPDERPATRGIGELAALILAAKRWDVERWRLGQYSDVSVFVAVVALTGMRQGEAAGLAWEDLEIDQRPAMLTVRHQARDGWRREHPEWTRPLDATKGKRVQTAVLHEEAAMALRWQRAELQRIGWYRLDGPVFPSSRGGGWRSHAMCLDPVTMRKLASDAGCDRIERWTVHCLRHSFCSLEAKGGDLKAVQERARHASLEQTMHYIHKLGDDLPAPGIPTLPGGAGFEDVAPALPQPAPAEGLARVTTEPSGAVNIETARAPGLDPVGDLVGSLSETKRQIVADREIVRYKRGRRKADWIAAQRKINPRPAPVLELARKNPEGIPQEIGEMADKHYARAYQAELRASENIEKARAKGTRARRYFLGTFKRLQAAERDRGVQPCR